MAVFQNLDTEFKTVLLLLALACALVVILTILLILLVRRSGKQKKAKAYAAAFLAAYEESGEVMTALEAGRNVYEKKNGKEASAIAAALDYIKHSILRDYRTAFKNVEAVIPGKIVKEAHKVVLEQEKQKKEHILLLTAKN